MRIVIIGLAVVLLLLQVELWRQVGQIGELRRQVEGQLEQNELLQERNDALAAEVADLKSGLDAVEERARAELGLIREGEEFYLVVEPEDLDPADARALRDFEAQRDLDATSGESQAPVDQTSGDAESQNPDEDG